jgi:cytoskeletal protein CcmA (bactofilin family)
MSFTAFGRGSEQNGSTSHSLTNGTRHNGNGNGSLTGNANGHLNGNGHSHANGHVDRHTNGNTNGNGNGHHTNGNGNGHTNGNGNGHLPNRFRPVAATLSAGVSIKGTIKFRSELVIDGEIEGTIDSIGRLTVGRNGHVRGDIRTRSVTVHGTVDGNLSAGEKCELRSGCTLRGDIETSQLVMDENVNFTGSAAIATPDYLAEMRCPNGKAQE